MQVTLPDGTVFLAQGRLGLIASDRPRLPDFALYLDERWEDDPEVSWPYRVFEWPDFGIPASESVLFDAIEDVHARATSGELVEIACYGGVGRTGTALGCLAVLAGVPAHDAVGWVRRNYDERAVETDAQCQLIERFAESR